MNNKIFFVSDLHLGANHPGSYPNREKHFCDFLDSLADQASHLFILGDLFEFWMEYRHYIPKRHFAMLAKLKTLTQAGVEIHYLSGNHDFNLGTFFGDFLDVKIHNNPLKINLQGKDLYLLHGDGLARSDWKYNILKKILRFKLSNFLFKLIHPDLGMKLAKLVGKTSRRLKRKSKKAAYEASGINLLKEADVVIHGHTHRFFIQPHENGTYINSGEWLKNLNYVQMEEGEFTLKDYLPPADSDKLSPSGKES